MAEFLPNILEVLGLICSTGVLGGEAIVIGVMKNRMITNTV